MSRHHETSPDRSRPVPRTIETPRLTLCPFEPDDWRGMHEHYSDVECTLHTFGRALTEGESWRGVASMVGHWQLRGYGPCAVVEKASSSVVGTVGLWNPFAIHRHPDGRP